jgi:hypothetical protein
MTRRASRPGALVAAALAIGCQAPRKPPVAAGESVATGDDPTTRLARLYAELEDDVLTSYDRDDPPDLDTQMIVARIGAARVGAGPADVYLAGDLIRAPSRWPLDVDRELRSEVRSKHLEVQIASDLSAAWMADELSWRIEACGRTAVIPLRITALYAHDGDRWVPVVEHLSFGWTPTPLDGPGAKPIKAAAYSDGLRDALASAIAGVLSSPPHDAAVVAQDASALVLGPDSYDEWHGPAALEARLPAGTLEDGRVGVVGRNLADATVAYWVGTYLADVPARPGFSAGKVRMRVTHVFEKRAPITGGGAPVRGCTDGKGCRWTLIQSHMSQPISDDALIQFVFGSAAVTRTPFRVRCADGAPAAAPPRVTPAAEPRRSAPPAATRTR